MFWSSSEDKVFEDGQEVVVHGLTGTQEINGKKGRCERWIEDTGQWSVRLESGEVRIVKPQNLQDIATAEAAAVVAQALSPTKSDQDCGRNEEADAAYEAIAAALQIFDLCEPLEDSTIAAANLEKVLLTHLGREDDVKRIQTFLSEHESNGDYYNFLSYWQGIDRYFQEVAARPQQAGRELDTIRGMQRFRDGVLAIHRQDSSQETIAATLLLGLLKEIRQQAEDPMYWDEVLQAIPDEEGFGLSMREVAEAVYIWLKDFTKASDVGGMGDATVGLEACSCGHVFSDDSKFCNMCGAARQVMQKLEHPTDSDQIDYDQCAEAATSRPDLLHSTSGLGMTSTASNGGGATTNMQRAAELTEIIAQRTPQDLFIVHQAVEGLVELHKVVESTMQDSMAEVAALEKSLDSLNERKDAMEGELDKSQRHAGELDQRVGIVEKQLQEQTRRAGLFEAQANSLLEQRDALAAELRSVKASIELYQHEKTEHRRQTLQTQAQMCKLEKDADMAEGQVSWLRSDVERLRKKCRDCKQIVQSYAGCSEEAEEVVEILQHQLSRAVSEQGDPSTNGAVAAQTQEAQSPVLNQDALVELEKQLELQKAQLQRLRVVRDDLLKAHDSFGTRADDGSTSPRELQVHRRCDFLGAQLQALLQHARNLECLLDDSSDAEPDAKRLMSVHRVSEESKKAFSEFEAELHTLEVKKEAVELEFCRLQTRLSEQENQLRAVQRHRDQLLVDAGVQPIDKVHHGDDHTVLEDDGLSSATSGTTPTRSGADPAFLFGSAAATRPADGQLRVSPKAPESVKKAVKTVIHAKTLAGADRWQRTSTTKRMTAKSQAHGFHVNIAPQSRGVAVPGTVVAPSAQAFDFSAPSASRMKSDHRQQSNDRSKEKEPPKEEKTGKKEKRMRRRKAEDVFSKGVNGISKEAGNLLKEADGYFGGLFRGS